MAGKVLVFSPPSKVVEGRAEEAEVPILLLQPFSKPPQVTFERIPVGREAVRQLKILNPTNTDHMVTLSGALRAKGFSADAEVFKLLPGQHQLVKFAWRPDGKETSSRLAVSVSTDKGYKGRFVMLGTVREEPKPLQSSRKNPVPKSSILTCSQKPNVSSRVKQAPKKVDFSPAQVCKKAVPPIRVTIPKEFKSFTSKNAGHQNQNSKASTPAQVSKKAASATSQPCKKAVSPVGVTVPKGFPSHPNKVVTSDMPASDLDVKLNTVSQKDLLKVPITCDPLIAGDAHSLLGAGTFSVVPAHSKSTDPDLLKAATSIGVVCRETFPSNAAALEATTNTTVDDSYKTANIAFENSREMSVNAFEDSLEPGKLADLASLDAETVGNSEENSDSGNNDTFELDLSTRMEMLYQQILQRQSSGTVGNSEENSDSGNNDTFELDFSAQMEMLHQQILQRQSSTSCQGDAPKTTTTSAAHEQMPGEQAKALMCPPQKAENEQPLRPPLFQATSNEQRCSSPQCPAKASKEDSLTNIENWLAELELGAGHDPGCSVDEGSLLKMIENYGSTEFFDDLVRVEDHFPADVSSISHQPGHSTHGF